MTLCYATHRLGGIATPANAAYSADELAYQLKNSGAKVLFTCQPLLETSIKACKTVGIPENRIYLLELPGDKDAPLKTVGQLVADGEKAPKIEPLKWEKGQGARQTAYLCYSSGTSGLPVRFEPLWPSDARILTIL